MACPALNAPESSISCSVALNVSTSPPASSKFFATSPNAAPNSGAASNARWSIGLCTSCIFMPKVSPDIPASNNAADTALKPSSASSDAALDPFSPGISSLLSASVNIAETPMFSPICFTKLNNPPAAFPAAVPAAAVPVAAAVAPAPAAAPTDPIDARAPVIVLIAPAAAVAPLMRISARATVARSVPNCSTAPSGRELIASAMDWNAGPIFWSTPIVSLMISSKNSMIPAAKPDAAGLIASTNAFTPDASVAKSIFSEIVEIVVCRSVRASTNGDVIPSTLKTPFAVSMTELIAPHRMLPTAESTLIQSIPTMISRTFVPNAYQFTLSRNAMIASRSPVTNVLTPAVSLAVLNVFRNLLIPAARDDPN